MIYQVKFMMTHDMAGKSRAIGDGDVMQLRKSNGFRQEVEQTKQHESTATQRRTEDQSKQTC